MKVYSFASVCGVLFSVAAAGAYDQTKAHDLCEPDHPSPSAVVTPAPTTPGMKPSAKPVNPYAPTKMPEPSPQPDKKHPTKAPTPGEVPTEAPPVKSDVSPSHKPNHPSTAPEPKPEPKRTPAPGPTSAAPEPEPSPDNPSPPSNGGKTQQTSGTVRSKHDYDGPNGGRPGVYEMVTDYASCAKTPHQTSSSVSPFDDDVTLVFRGPMNIYNIAIFDGSSGAWKKVSSYEKGGKAENMVFFNNKNIDYDGKSSPVGYSSEDGRSVAQHPTPFGGHLGSATKPGGYSIYADEATGAEVHVMTEKQCGKDVECKGYYDKEGPAHYGWAGTKKLFITKVDMPNGGAPNMPAIWMLNGQVVRANQYQCNCRGMGKAGGCGELDIAEVIEKDLNKIATHYYFYDGNPAPGHDRFTDRPTDAPTTYITIIDESYGAKVVEIGPDDFDFSCDQITDEVVKQWLAA